MLHLLLYFPMSLMFMHVFMAFSVGFCFMLIIKKIIALEEDRGGKRAG